MDKVELLVKGNAPEEALISLIFLRKYLSNAGKQEEKYRIIKKTNEIYQVNTRTGTHAPDT